MLALHDLQAQFFAALTRPARGAAPPALLATIDPSPTLDAAERLAVYRGMYHARLLEVLHEDFPATAAVLGTARMNAICRRYIARHPSSHPSLRFFGARFAEHLARSRAARAQPYVVDLARLEWIRLAVFDAPDPEPLRLSALRDTPADEWGGLRFRVIDACATLTSPFPVHEIWTRIQSPGRPATNERFDAGPIAPAATLLRVWREGHTIYQASMEPLEHEALAVIAADAPFATLCEHLAERVGVDEAPARAGALLARWIEDAILEPAAPAR